MVRKLTLEQQKSLKLRSITAIFMVLYVLIVLTLGIFSDARGNNGTFVPFLSLEGRGICAIFFFCSLA
jgi:fumarate reductase subunit C